MLKKIIQRPLFQKLRCKMHTLESATHKKIIYTMKNSIITVSVSEIFFGRQQKVN